VKVRLTEPPSACGRDRHTHKRGQTSRANPAHCYSTHQEKGGMGEQIARLFALKAYMEGVGSGGVQETKKGNQKKTKTQPGSRGQRKRCCKETKLHSAKRQLQNCHIFSKLVHICVYGRVQQAGRKIQAQKMHSARGSKQTYMEGPLLWGAAAGS